MTVINRLVPGEKDPVRVATAINQMAEFIDGTLGAVTEADLASGSATSLTTVVTKNIASISLGAGNWDVSGVTHFQPAATTTTTVVSGGLTTTSATFDITNGRFSQIAWAPGTNVQNPISTPIIPCRFNLTTTTVVYLIAIAIFGTSTMTCYGHIRARRVG